MSALPKTQLTPAEYLEIERAAEFRSEFHDGEMFAMAGEREAHSLLCCGLIGELRQRLKGKPCRVYSPNMKVRLATGNRFVYPDVAGLCGASEFFDATQDALTNPTFIAEVLSKSTAAYDRGDKFGYYMRLPSLMEYVLVSQWDVEVERFTRQSDGIWQYERLTGPEAVLRSAALGCEIPLREIYDGVELSPPIPPPIERDENR